MKKKSLLEIQCEHLFDSDNINEAYDYIEENIYEIELNNRDLEYIMMVYDNEIISNDLCMHLNDFFVQSDENFDDEFNYENLDKFITKNCDRYKYVYHGTTYENAKKMTHEVIFPSIGKFVEDMYGQEYTEGSLKECWDSLEVVVFASNLDDIMKTVGAINYHTKNNYGLGKGVILKLDASDFLRASNTMYGDYPIGVEPNDYYSENDVPILGVLTDEIMINKYGNYDEIDFKNHEEFNDLFIPYDDFFNNGIN